MTTPMNTEQFLKQLSAAPESINFEDTMACIDENYHFTETAFQNAILHNAAGENNGSCKIFSFAKQHQLSEQNTLHCFGDYYRKDVLENPNAENHQNIRNFILHGWEGIRFEDIALLAK